MFACIYTPFLCRSHRIFTSQYDTFLVYINPLSFYAIRIHTHVDDNDTDVKIADFGMARFVDTLEPDEDPYVAVSYMLNICILTYYIYTLYVHIG